MRLVSLLAMLVASLIACSSQTPQKPQPPAGFPDLSSFTAVNPADYTLGGATFVSPRQVSCILNYGPHKTIACGGSIPGMPASVSGTGCPSVDKPDDANSDAPYGIYREDHPCVTARWVPMGVGKKLVGKNGTCAVGDGGLVACIDTDNKHGFVLQPSGSWTF
jgi:hypothetical protein